MKVRLYRLIIILNLLVLLTFVACQKNVETQKEKKPVISADVPVDDTENANDNEQAKPIHIGVEKITLSKYSVNIVQGSSDMPIVTMHPENSTNKAEIWSSNDTSVATVNNLGKITGVGVGSCTVTVRSADNKNAFADVSVTVTPYIAPKEPEITYIDGILIANKSYPLPSTYNPGVDTQANTALQEMFAAAKVDGLNLFVKSGFRSFSTQKSLYNSYVKRDGKAAADRYSARPGYSDIKRD